MPSDDQFQASHTPFDFTKYKKPYEIRRIEILSKVLASVQGETAVDIGCGPGFFSKMLASKGWSVTAIDTDRENVESAGQYAQETHLGNAPTILATFPESYYDLILALEIVEHMPKSHAADLLAEITRTLKPRGSLIISTPNRFSLEGLGGYYWGEKIRGRGKWTAWDSTHVHIYSSLEILQLLRTCGFAIDRITGYHYEGRFPVIGRLRLPLVKSTVFPLNRLGFNVIIECHKR